MYLSIDRRNNCSRDIDFSRAHTAIIVVANDVSRQAVRSSALLPSLFSLRGEGVLRARFARAPSPRLLSAPEM